MKKIVLLLGALLLLALTLPVLGQDSTVNDTSFNGFSFSYDPSLGSILTIEIEPGDAPDAMQPGGPIPPNTYYAIYNPSTDPATPVANPLFAPNGIRVYLTADIADYEQIQASLTALQDLLTNRPDLSTYETVPDDPTQRNGLPVLYGLNASQVIRAQANYVDLDTIEGISYIAAYRQDAAPFYNNSFVYTFQGISKDGTYAIYASFALATDLFPSSYPSGYDYDALATNYTAYLQESAATLNNASPDDFTPSLTTLDAVINSFSFAGE